MKTPSRPSRPSRRWTIGWIACCLPELVVPTVTAAPAYKLTQAVPDDVFLCVAGRHNPAREFVDAYWGEVIEALKSSGVLGDAMELVSSFMGDEQKQEAERFGALATELINGVDWKRLCGGEVVFAERWNAAQYSGRNVNMGPPEMVLLFRGQGDNAGKDLNGLKAILKAIADEVNQAVGRPILGLKESSHMGIETTTLNVQEIDGQDVPFAITVARHDDIILLAQGDKLLHETLVLLTDGDGTGSIAESPRFNEAFAKLPPAEDSLVFFDVQRILQTPREILEFVTAERNAKGADKITSAGFCKEANALNRDAIAAYRKKDYKKALDRILAANELAPKDSLIMYNVACFQALNGHREKAVSWLEKSVEGGFYCPKQIADDSDLKDLRDDPRFTAALNKAREMALKHTGGDMEMKEVKRIADYVLDIPGMFDYVATVEYTRGYSVHAETLAALVPGADQKPFYKVFGTKKPLTEYHRYLPKETVSFSVDDMVDLNELYGFLEDTARTFGPKGEQILAKWKALQEQFGFDVGRDVLSWLSGETISMELATEFGTAHVWMLKVTDEAVAKQKLDATLRFVSTQLQQMTVENPMLAMLAVRTSPCTNEKLPGFHNIQIGMSPQPAVCGVADGYIMVGSSAGALELALATAAGDHPDITKNEQMMAEAVLPEGEFQSLRFDDRRTLNKEIRQILDVVTMVGGLGVMGIPDPQAQQAATKALGIVAKLGPVVNEIDFYKSAASCTTFDSSGWRCRQVTNYREPVKTASGVN